MAEPESPPTVLVVEDEEEVRSLTRDVLEMHGYAVLEALDSADALRLGETHPGRLDLLITDVVMPRMSGPELARRLRARRPELRVLCMSGYPEGAQRGVTADAGTWNAWLQKPFSPDGLIAKVRECLTS
ncbi:MAG TPA: response regulator [Methylomirabilota bacterium]|nr:response regulator [Methylomirabilota bacterium]